MAASTVVRGSRAALLTGALLACVGDPTSPAMAVVGPTPGREVGSRARVAPPGAAFVDSFPELARAVADRAGPSEVWLRPRTYRGDLVVTRPLAIRGEDGATLEGTGTSTVLTIAASDVTIENIHVRHSGRRGTTEDAGLRAAGDRVRIVDVHLDDVLFGVLFKACHACLLERAHIEGDRDADEPQGDGISLWESNDSVVRGAVVEHARDFVVWYTRRALIEDNVLRHGRYGVHFMYAHDSIARGNHIEGAVVGIFAMYSQRLVVENNVLAGAHGAAGIGLGFKESDAVRVHGNWIVANTTGTYLDYTPRTPGEPVVFERNVFALNDVAVRLHGGNRRGDTFHANDFRDNGQTIETDGGGDALACDVRGNHFTDYEGYDLDGNGVGDVPHRVSELSTELADRHPALKFFYGTTAMHLVDAIAHAVPVLDSHTLLADGAPLMRAPEVPVR
jgi:nitrous oxidase accessory protein